MASKKTCTWPLVRRSTPGPLLAIGEEGQRLQALEFFHHGQLMLEENNLEEAEKSFRHSLEIDERLGDKVNAASSLHELGRCLWKQHQYKPAEFLLKKALANLDTNQPTDLNKKKLSVFVLS